jgi:hemerythrin-like domain-containing protein
MVFVGILAMTQPLPTRPLESLSREHQLIARTLTALEAFTEKLEESAPVDLADLTRFVAFFADYAEASHHVKEEDVLLPAMAKAGFDWDSGPVARIRADHDQERYLVRVLNQAAQQDSAWTEEARRHAIASLRAFIDYQRRHIEREETMLYPAAAERLTPKQLAEVDAQLKHFDQDRVGDAELARLHAMAQELVQKYPR